MDRRSFFRIFAALPVVGVAAMASAGKDPKEPDHVLKGNVVIEGSLVVNGVETGTALAAGDVPSGSIKGQYAGMYCVGARNDLQRAKIGDMLIPFSYPVM